MKRILLIVSVLLNVALLYGVGKSLVNESKMEKQIAGLQTYTTETKSYQDCLNNIKVYETKTDDKTEFVLFSDIKSCQD